MNCYCTDDDRAVCRGVGVAWTDAGCFCPCHRGGTRRWTAEQGYGCPAATAPVPTIASLTAERDELRAALNAALAALESKAP